MLRLTLLLCAIMIAALFTAGEDHGQMRPGLAKAAAEGMTTEPAIVPQTAAPVITAAAKPPPTLAPVVEPAPEAAPTYVEPPRDVVQVVEEPVFTLSALGNELVPGEDAARDGMLVAEPAPQPAPENAVWYVNADQVNVRAAPSTEAEIVGKLGTGEAALVVAEVGTEWAKIRIEGDGMEGYVALRYLTPGAP
jgi:uncharacterized protein YgiM (DUF1202 family)